MWEVQEVAIKKMQESQPEGSSCRGRKSLGGNTLCSSSPEHSSKLMWSFLSPVNIMGMHRGRDSEVERSLNPEGDMCFWLICSTQEHLIFFTGRVQPGQVPTWSGTDWRIKAMWVCVR